MATSGTVSGHTFNMARVIDHAYRRAGVQPEQLASEQLQIAQDLVFTLTSEWVNAGFPLWTRRFHLLNAPIGSTDVVMPTGTVDVRTAYWRRFNPYRGTATTSTGADASTLFSGQPEDTDVTVTGPDAGIVVDFTTDIELDTVGVLLGGSSVLTASLVLKGSQDGITYETLKTFDSTTFEPGKWTYFDLNPTLTAQFFQLVLPTGTFVLNQLNFCQSQSYDIPMGPVNIDDYYNLPNKAFRSSQPNTSFVDRQLPNVILKIWPTLNVEAFYDGAVAVLVRRYIEDPGELVDDVEVPQRWLEALIWRLSHLLAYEMPPTGDQGAWANRVALLEKNVTRSEGLAWAEERVKAPIRLAPDISPYTR